MFQFLYRQLCTILNLYLTFEDTSKFPLIIKLLYLLFVFIYWNHSDSLIQIEFVLGNDLNSFISWMFYFLTALNFSTNSHQLAHDQEATSSVLKPSNMYKSDWGIYSIFVCWYILFLFFLVFYPQYNFMLAAIVNV